MQCAFTACRAAVQALEGDAVAFASPSLLTLDGSPDVRYQMIRLYRALNIHITAEVGKELNAPQQSTAMQAPNSYRCRKYDTRRFPPEYRIIPLVIVVIVRSSSSDVT